MYTIFSQAVLSTPDAIAVVMHNGRQHTYASAAEHVHQWAHYLLQQGIQAHDRVGVLLDDEDQHVFILLALERIHAQYVPFDTDIPPQQFFNDLQTVQIKKCIVEASLLSTFSVEPSLLMAYSTSVAAEIAEQPKTQPPVAYDSQDPNKIVYLVSSSGSTGNKKWIPIGKAGLEEYWAKTEKILFEKEPLKKVLSTRSPAYDARISEYVRTFTFGAALHLLSRTQRKDFSYILEVCQREQISCILLIANQLHAANAEKVLLQLQQAKLRHLMVTGDACTPVVKQYCETLGIYLWNCYGPTEATFGLSALCVNDLPLLERDGNHLLPIGKPVGDDIHYYLRDGKLYIASPYLTPGYLDTENNQKYFSLIETQRGTERVFDTGDTFIESGDFLYYMGRYNAESHCKVDGVKVTTFFIENCLNQYAATLQAVVVIKNNKPVAYLLITEPLDKKAFQHYIEAHLSKEQRPICIHISAFPMLSISGKVDRRQLIMRQDTPSEYLFLQGGAQESPIAHDRKSHIESQLKEIWRDILHLGNHPIIGDIDFTFLGGTSVTAMEMVQRIQQSINPDYSYQQLLRLKELSINALCDSILVLETAHAIPVISAPIHRLVEDKTYQGNIFLLPPLLGFGGSFTYQPLAERMAPIFHENIYGLSDPAIGSTSLVLTAEEKIAAYVKAIRTVQPNGSFTIAGFSNGAIWAYLVALALSANDASIDNLYLLDGFSPYFYQALPESAHYEFLKSLMQFMIEILTKPPHNETLPVIHYPDILAFVTKTEQVKQCFTILGRYVKHAGSKELLHIAEQNLHCLFKLPLPEKKSAIWPTLYLTSGQQKYAKIIGEIPKLSAHAADYRYYFWNRYFENMTRCGVQLLCDHLSLLNNHPSYDRQTAESYWRRAHDPLFNLKIDHYGPRPRYRLQRIGVTAQYCLWVFFIPQRLAKHIQEYLNKWQIETSIVSYDKNLQLYEQRDQLYSDQAYLCAEFPINKITALQHYMRSLRITSIDSTLPSSPVQNMKITDKKMSGNVQLALHWNRDPDSLMTFSLPYHLYPTALMMAAAKYLNLIPDASTGPMNLVYKYHFIFMQSGSFWDVLEHTAEFLADFIVILQTHNQQHKEAIFTRPTTPTFFQRDLSSLGNVIQTLVRKDSTIVVTPRYQPN